MLDFQFRKGAVLFQFRRLSCPKRKGNNPVAITNRLWNHFDLIGLDWIHFRWQFIQSGNVRELIVTIEHGLLAAEALSGTANVRFRHNREEILLPTVQDQFEPGEVRSRQKRQRGRRDSGRYFWILSARLRRSHLISLQKYHNFHFCLTLQWTWVNVHCASL